MDRAQRIVRLVRLLADDTHRVGRIVAADVEEVLDFVRLQHLEDFLAIGQVGLVAGGSQRRGGRGSHQFQVVAGFLGQVDEILVDDATHTVTRTVDPLNIAVASRLQRHADHRLVDHRRRSAALCDQNFSGCPYPSFRIMCTSPIVPSRRARRKRQKKEVAALRRRWAEPTAGAAPLGMTQIADQLLRLVARVLGLKRSGARASNCRVMSAREILASASPLLAAMAVISSGRAYQS